MYEKVKIQQATGAEAEGINCFMCDRERSVVFCNACGHRIDNMRARKTCDTHPKEMFLMDLSRCTKCKSGDLLEVGIDDIPEHILNPRPVQMPEFSFGAAAAPSISLPTNGGFSSFQQQRVPLMPSQPVASSSFTVREAPQNFPLQMPGTSFHTGLAPSTSPSFGEAGFARGRSKRARVIIPPSGLMGRSPSSEVSRTPLAIRQERAQPPPPPRNLPPVCAPPAPIENIVCNCQRLVEYVMCSKCGFYQEGAMKYIQCPVHVNVRRGIRCCPKCEAPAEDLDESEV